MKLYQNQGLSIFTLCGAYSAIFNPTEDIPAREIYVGLSTKPLTIISTQIDEPTSKSYQRAHTSGNDWNVELKRSDKILVLTATNKNSIMFQPITDSWGDITAAAVFIGKATTQFSAYCPLSEPITVAPVLGEKATSQGFKEGKLTFAMPILEETEENENIIATILKGEESIMIGKTLEYVGCPFEKPESCSEHMSELRCALKRPDKICKKIARLKGTGRPGMSANTGRKQPKG